MTKVVMYGYDGCRYCSAAKNLLDDHGIAFEHRDCEEEPGRTRPVSRSQGTITQDGSSDRDLWSAHRRLRQPCRSFREAVEHRGRALIVQRVA